MNPSRIRTVPALGIVQIISWGSTFYLMTVLATPLMAETGWSPELISAGLSSGLLISGLASPFVGRLIQKAGGRQVMAAGMLLIAAGLSILAFAGNPAVYFLAWAVLGIGMACSLYDAAFSSVGALFGRDARMAITQLTLWGGFASTICWPVLAWLVDMAGWRGACLAFAFLHLTVTLPLTLFALPRRSPATAGLIPADVSGSVLPGLLDPRFLCIVIAGVVTLAMFSMMSVHIVMILISKGHSLSGAIAVSALFGPAQVAARILEMLGGGRHHPVYSFCIAAALLLLGLGGLLAGMPAAAAVAAYGAGHGLWTIVRGSLPLALFGPGHYAPTMGRLALPMLIASAAGPTLGAFLFKHFGPQGMLEVLAGAALIPFAAALALLVLHRRQPSR